MKLFDKYDRKAKIKDLKILDLGCGVHPMSNANILMDKDPSIGKLFKDKEFIRHDANILPYPFEDNSIDYIYLNQVLEHLTIEDDVLFKELYRILRMYGKIELSVPNSLFIYHRLLYFFGIIPCNFILCHRKHYSFQQLKHNLRNAGFKIYEINNKWIFNPFKNFIYTHIKIIAKKSG